MSSMPIEIAEKIAAIGPVFNPEVAAETRALYAPLVNSVPLTDVTVTRDLAYGADPRQKLDLYHGHVRGPQPERGGQRLPILAYFPGGGFVGGDKNADGTFYGNVGAYFACHGMLGIVANYRLAPAHPWPAGAEDVGNVIAWIKANAETHGGDPTRIFLWGQSAGATHAASYLFDLALRSGDGPGVVAAILTSGFYRVTKAHTAPGIRAYFGEDEAQFAERSPISHARRSRVPLFLSVAEYDPAFLAAPTLELAAAVCVRDGKCPPLVWFEGHNHVSTVFSIGTKDDEVGSRVLEFIGRFR